MANEQIMFYIIVPIFNVERYLRKCLDSLLSQSYTQWKAILVNDGSTDSSGEIAQEYANKDARFVTLNQENQGQSMARNAGLEYVKNLIISTNPPPPTIFELYSFFRF
ncbi:MULTISPECIES: glycosyltransferase [Helicobacter]|nr:MULTISPECIES: glycosyltransferase [Helicobacter]